MSGAGPLIDVATLVAMGETPLLLDARPLSDGRPGISGARRADLESDLSSPGDASRGGRHPLPDLRSWRRTLASWGIRSGRTVVVYDASGGAMAACRAWWMIRAAGHDEVAVLDGGLDAALAAGLETGDARSETVPEAAPVDGSPEWSLPRVDADEVDRLRFDPRARLLDVRDAARYRGDSEPYDPVAGHIPGAINLPYRNLLAEDGRFLRGDELRVRLGEALDGAEPSRVAVYCGSGVTACHTLFALELAGFRGAALYVGSWSEWCRSARPRVAAV